MHSNTSGSLFRALMDDSSTLFKSLEFFTRVSSYTDVGPYTALSSSVSWTVVWCGAEDDEETVRFELVHLVKSVFSKRACLDSGDPKALNSCKNFKMLSILASNVVT